MKTTGKNRTVLLIGLLSIGAYVVNYYLRNILSVATPELLLTGDFTETSVGLLSSTYMLFYAGGQLVNGFLGDMVPPQWMLLGGIGLGGGAVMLFPFLSRDPLRLACFALLGFGLSMVRGPLMKVISESTEPRQARLICVFFSAASFAGPLIASLFVMALPVRPAFVAAGAAAVLMALGTFSAFARMQKTGILTFRPIKTRSLGDLLGVFRIENFVYYMVVACLVEISAASVSFWIPTYLTAHLGFDTTAANLVFSAISVCRSCMPFLSLMLFNAAGERALPLMRTGFALSALFFLAMQFVSHPAVNVALLVLALMSMSLTSAMLWSIYIPGLGKTGRASSANGVLDCTGYIAAAGANLLFAAVSGWASWNTVLLLWASVGAIGVAATFFAKPESRA